ncbi:MAG: putative bifunctional diguanylate cyclase/phosphodiesterase [Pontibacterium sp.]
MNILIVDDDRFDREHLKRSLRQSVESLVVAEATNVDEGIEVYRQGQFDVILLDYLMPQKNGLDMMRELRNVSAENKTAVVMMSAFEQEEVALECLRQGVQDFLLKSEITAVRLRRAILHAKARFELEAKLVRSYQRVKQLAESDALTGLTNRYQFDELLRQAVNQACLSDTKLAVLMIDLDQFKYVNDYYGHAMGDELLRRVALRFKSCLVERSTLARLGGDEFAIIIEQVLSAQEYESLALKLIEVLEQPFELGNAKVAISASIGIAVLNNLKPDISSLLKHADIALYDAKHRGRNCFSIFEPKMEEKFAYRYTLETRLKTAVADDEFVLYYQPVFSQDYSQITGFEALIRWFPDGNFCSPDDFIPVAEETGSINEIGDWVIGQALSQLREWQTLSGRHLSMAINVSSVQLANPDLVNFLSDKIKEEGLEPSQVEIELTETALLNDERVKVETIQRIHDLGCKIALDDFGTGFSSITHLRNFPIDVVKVDRSLMPKNSTDEKALGLLHGVVLMIKAMKLSIVAEGIEDDYHAGLCQSLGIERAQGYYLARPTPVKDMPPLLGSKAVC